MNIEYLHDFLDVAQTKSIAKAAKLNFISPQGMSRAMNELEKELGCSLFIRYSNKLTLSPEGEKLIEPIKNVVKAYNELLDQTLAVTCPAPAAHESILLECQNVARLAFLDEKAKDFIFATHGIIFREGQNAQIRQSLVESLEERTAASPAPIGLFCFFNPGTTSETTDLAALERKGLSYKPYLRSYDKVMVSTRSPLAEKESLTDDDIASCPIVTTNSHLYSVLAHRFGRDAISISSPDFSLRRQMVESNAAISFLPAIAELTMPDDAAFVLRSMERPYEVEIGFAAHPDAFDMPLFKQLTGILDNFYQAHRKSDLFTLLD